MMTKEIVSRNYASLLDVRRRVGKLLLKSVRNGNEREAKKYEKLILNINKDLRYFSKRYSQVKFF